LINAVQWSLVKRRYIATGPRVFSPEDSIFVSILEKATRGIQTEKTAPEVCEISGGGSL